jgi:hypothetical protein
MASYAPIGQAGFSTSAAFGYSPLLSDGHHVVSRSGTVASGTGILKRGQVCKIVPATGVITIGATAAEANCVLSNDVDATSATVAAEVYLSGKMKADAIVWPGALSHADVTDALRNYGILIESVVFTDGTLVKSVPTVAEQSAGEAVVEKNREEETAVKEGEAAAPPKISVDSPWAYLSAEEREKDPGLAAPPTLQEIGDAVGGGEGGGTIPDVPPVTISPTSATAAASGGTGSVAVTITGPGASGTWIATKDSTATWLTFSPSTPQSASGTVTWTAAANTGGSRSANLYINGKTFALTQSAGI